MLKRSVLCLFGILAGCGPKASPTTTTPPNELAPVVDTVPASPAPAGTSALPQTPESHPPSEGPDLHAVELSAYEKAKPVFEKFCANCHTQGRPGARSGTLAHFDTTVYPFAGHHSDDLAATVRAAIGATGGKATMPRNKPGAVQGEDLALIRA